MFSSLQAAPRMGGGLRPLGGQAVPPPPQNCSNSVRPLKKRAISTMDVMAQTAKKLANDMPVTQEELAAFVGTHGAPTLAGSTPAHVAGLLKERLYEMSMMCDLRCTAVRRF